MIISAIAVFALAAILGMVLLSYVLNNKETPKGVAFIHGPFAAAGLVLLIIYAFKNSPAPVESIVIFTIAALGGMILITRDLIGKSIPKWFAVLHGSLAVVGFIFLILYQVNK